MKLGIVGSRRRNTQDDKTAIGFEIELLKPEMIISGGCSKGADQFAYELAKEKGIPITIFFPKPVPKGSHYYEYVEANYTRNKLIAEASDALLALVAEDRKGGTENTIKYFEKKGGMLIIR